MYQVEPFGEVRADMRSALIASIIANVNRGKNQKAFSLSDFMFDFEPKKPQSPEEMKTLLQAFTNQMNRGKK
jgi:hypothetical protein